jgi:branched-chain amino acid transport system substrate-binding protein
MRRSALRACGLACAHVVNADRQQPRGSQASGGTYRRCGYLPAMWWAVALLICGPAAHGQVGPRTVEVAQIVPRSGPLANVGNELVGITQAAFEDFNRGQGEVLLKLRALDDGNVGARSAQLAAELPRDTIALVSCFGTVGCIAQQGVADKRRMPLVGPIAGAEPLRGPQSGMSYAVRASASDELRKLLSFAQTTGLTRIAVLVQEDGFGQAYAAQLEREAGAFRDLRLELHRFDPASVRFPEIAARMQREQHSALLLLANASHSTGFLNTWRESSTLPFVLNLAAQANALFASRLKGYAGAAAFVTVTPSPWTQRTALQRDYQRVAKKAGLAFSYLGLEAYVNARLLIDSVQRSGARTGPELARYLDSLAARDLGGFVVDYARLRRGGSFTDLSLLRSDGSYVH